MIYGIYLLITGKYGDVENNGRGMGRLIGVVMILSSALGSGEVAVIIRAVLFFGVFFSSISSIMIRPKQSQSEYADGFTS
jgi:hypothetical protein